MNEKLYINPLDFAAGNDSAAIQAAVDQAVSTGIRAVVIPAKADGGAWKVEKTVLLPRGITVILDGCTIQSGGTIFANANAYNEDTKSLGGEEPDLFLIGKGGARLTGTAQAPQVYFSNVKDFRIAGVVFEQGEGLKLHFARAGKVQQLKFENTEYGIAMSEGCSGLLISDIDGVTRKETLVMQGGASTLYGRDPDMRKSIFSRIRAKTDGAPVVGLYAGEVPLSYLILRDVTDLTEGDGVSVRLGETQQEIRDITIRGVDTKRGAVETTAVCDGLHCANLGGSFVAQQENTRSRVDEKREAVALPHFDEERQLGAFITPNDPVFYGETDAKTIQNAADAAAKQGVSLVIPRWNARTQSTVWNMEKAIVLPSDLTVVLWGAYLRQANFCYENIFAAKDASRITITGVGDAVLDGGLPNGLLEKNAGKYGFGPIQDNAMLRFTNVSDLTIEHFRVKQSRWYAMYLEGCTNLDVGNVDFATYTVTTDQGGVRLCSGCANVRIHEITGVVSGDLIALDARGCYTAGKEIRNVEISRIKADPRRYAMISLTNHDGHQIHNVSVDMVMDVSLAEQKMSPPNGIRIGTNDGYYERRAQEGELSGITVRDMCTRATWEIVLESFAEGVKVDNIHGFSGTAGSVLVQKKAQVRDVKMSNIYFRCDQASSYMRGTATSIITDKKKYKGVVLDLGNLTGDVTVDGVLAERIRGAVKVTGNAKVQVSGLEFAECGVFYATCGATSELTVNGETVSPA